ncbi:MAG: rRNA maturation RNase YbeY [Alphaproteobacteria bacterium]
MSDTHHFFEIVINHNTYSDNRDLKNLCSKVAEKALVIGLSKNNDLSGIPYPAEANILLTDDEFIKALNFKYRGMNSATNVLSFAAIDGKDSKSISEEAEIFSTLILGDIIISLDTIEKEAQEFLITFEDRLAHIIIHGVLHLVGFDHQNDDEANVMEKLEASILAEMGFANPYN